MTKSEAIYAKFEAIEEQVAHCYFLLHERFIRIPNFAKFWLDAALVELQHSSILWFCREHECMAKLELTTRAIGKIEDLLETVKGVAADPDVSMDEALYASLLLESSELEQIYDKLTSGLEQDHEMLYQAMTANLRAHHDGFARAAEEFATKPGIAAAFKELGGNRAG